MKKILITLVLLLSITTIVSAQDDKKCKATTTKGQPCKSKIGIKDGYCTVHNPNTLRCGTITSSKKPCRIPVTKEGEKCRHHKE